MEYAPGQTIPLGMMRKAIIRTVSLSNETIPHFYAWTDVTADRIIEARQAAPVGARPSLNAYIIKAAAQTLRRHPCLNATLIDDGVHLLENVNIGIAVALNEGLVIPVIRRADRLSLAEIDAAMKDLVRRARGRRLAPEDYKGGSFTVSNLGMYGIHGFAAIVQPPQAAILAVGITRPAWLKTDVGWGEHAVMTMTLSADHRIVDGAPAAEFLTDLRSALEGGEW